MMLSLGMGRAGAVVLVQATGLLHSAAGSGFWSVTWAINYFLLYISWLWFILTLLRLHLNIQSISVQFSNITLNIQRFHKLFIYLFNDSINYFTAVIQ